MSAPLTAAYRSQRLRLANTVQAATAGVWAQGYRDRERVIAEVLALVTGGQAQTVALVDAYMAAMTAGSVKGLNVDRFTVAELRGLPAEEVYGRPFGALGGQLDEGAKLGAAIQSAQASLGRLVRTDLQLAQTHSARDWMAGDERIVGYRRVTSGKACGLCLAASTQRYHVSNLLPIHESCSCSVSPITGTGPSPRIIDPDTWRVVKDQARGDLSFGALRRLEVDGGELPAVTAVAADPELGLRLVEPDWAAAQ